MANVLPICCTKHAVPLRGPTIDTASLRSVHFANWPTRCDHLGNQPKHHRTSTAAALLKCLPHYTHFHGLAPKSFAIRKGGFHHLHSHQLQKTLQNCWSSQTFGRNVGPPTLWVAHPHFHPSFDRGHQLGSVAIWKASPLSGRYAQLQVACSHTELFLRHFLSAVQSQAFLDEWSQGHLDYWWRSAKTSSQCLTNWWIWRSGRSLTVSSFWRRKVPLVPLKVPLLCECSRPLLETKALLFCPLHWPSSGGEGRWFSWWSCDG